MNFIVRNVVAAIEHYDAVTVVIDVIVLDPTESCFDTEDTF